MNVMDIRKDIFDHLPSCPVCGARPYGFVDDFERMRVIIKGCEHMGAISLNVYKMSDNVRVIRDLCEAWEDRVKTVTADMNRRKSFNKKRRNMLTKRSLMPHRSVNR